MSDAESNLQRDPVEELAEEFADRLRRGEHPSINEYKQKHPQWAERIRQVFSALLVMERLTGLTFVSARGYTDGCAETDPLGEIDLLVDGFVDHDRSYYPHHGLIDRRYNPRRALYRLIAVSSGMARL